MSQPIKKTNQLNTESYSPKTPKLANMMEQAGIDNSYPMEFVLPDKSTQIPPEIKHYGPAYVSFANEFSHFLDYIGQGYGFIFEGDWCKDRSYTIADIISGNATQPADFILKEDIEYLWETAGFSLYHTFYADPSHSDYLNKTDMIKVIKYTLCTLGQPVIIPQDEYFCGSIIVGYKDNGNTLLAYYYLPYFMDMENNAEPKISEVSNWYNENTSLFIAGKREETFSIEDIYRKGIQRIYDCLRININGEKRHYYDEWEAFLRMDKNEMLTEVRRIGIVPGGEKGEVDKGKTDEELWDFICSSYNTTWCNMAERRFYVMNFFRQAKEYFPEMQEGLQALDVHFWYANDIMGNKETGYNSEIGDPAKIEIFENPDVRIRMADCVKKFREADELGLEKMKTLLKKEIL